MTGCDITGDSEQTIYYPWREGKALAIPVIAFANADGGTAAVGIEDKGDISGIDGQEKHINELLRVPFDYCLPSVNAATEILDCTDIVKEFGEGVQEREGEVTSPQSPPKSDITDGRI